MGTPLALMTFVCLGVTKAIRGHSSIRRDLWRNILLSIAFATLVCLLLAGLLAWLLQGFHGPDNDPPSG